MYKQFMVVQYTRQFESAPHFSTTFNQYDEAFDAFNKQVADEAGQLLKQPRGEKPLRCMLPDTVIELWVITRTDELVKL